jgi:hypothetical protein
MAPGRWLNGWGRQQWIGEHNGVSAIAAIVQTCARW